MSTKKTTGKLTYTKPQDPRRLEELPEYKGAFKKAIEAETKWEPLDEHDLVDVVAPGSACQASELRSGQRVITDWGFIPRVPKGLLNPGPLFSNSDEKRMKYLQEALESEDAKVIWSLRGGYGSNRLLPDLSDLKEPSVQKYLIGYSDITTLHVFVQQEWGWPSLHGPLVERLGSGEHPKADLARLKRILTGEQTVVVFKDLMALNSEARHISDVIAPITGGNLCVLTSSIGTPWQLETKGKFLFLEEIGEKPHRVDRFFVHLMQSGVLKGCKGILLGNFLVEKPSHQRVLWSDVIADFAEKVGVPVLRGLPVGHGKQQKSLPLGTTALLQKSSGGGTLYVSTGVQS